MNLLNLFSLPSHMHRACLSKNAEKVILHAGSRKFTFRAAVLTLPSLSSQFERNVDNSSQSSSHPTQDSDLMDDFIQFK
jgi:hypothetical protein